MFNTNNLIKFGASAAGALLILLLVNWGASSLYAVGPTGGHGDGHGDEEHGPVRGYVVASADDAAAEEEEVEEVSFADLYAAADADKGAKVWGKCKACHKLEEGAHATGPELYGVVDRPVAEVAGFEFSAAMLEHAGKTWTPEELDAWLANPKEYAPGNKMTFAGLKKPADRVNLIAYLATIGG